MKDLLTLREACDMLRVHPNTLRNWERENKISTVRIGSRRDRRFFRDEIEKLITLENENSKIQI